MKQLGTRTEAAISYLESKIMGKASASDGMTGLSALRYLEETLKSTRLRAILEEAKLHDDKNRYKKPK